MKAYCHFGVNLSNQHDNNSFPALWNGLVFRLALLFSLLLGEKHSKSKFPFYSSLSLSHSLLLHKNNLSPFINFLLACFGRKYSKSISQIIHRSLGQKFGSPIPNSLFTSLEKTCCKSNLRSFTVFPRPTQFLFQPRFPLHSLKLCLSHTSSTTH